MLHIRLIILALILNITAKAQQTDTIANFEINKDVYCYYLSNIDTSYHGTDRFIKKQLDSIKLNIELINYINTINRDYVKIGDTLKVVYYQNKSQTYPLNVERVIIQTNNNIYIKTLEQLSPDIRQNLYIIKLKIIENIKKGYYYEN